MAQTDWRLVIKDPKLIRAFEALEDPRWDWRTASAIAKASGLTEAQVAQFPVLYPTLVRRSLSPGQAGGYVYTLQSKHFANQSPLQKAITFISSSSSSSS